MDQTSLSVWFVCKLCRGSFGQVDAFIEHKKQKHFTQFQNTTSIVFEEREQRDLCPVMIKIENELVDEKDEPGIKIEVRNDDDTVSPFNSDIIDEPNYNLLEPKSELITYEGQVHPYSEINFFGVRQPQSQQNPFVLLKRLTSKEIQSECAPQHHPAPLKFEQKLVACSSEAPNSLDSDSNIIDHNELEKSPEIRPTTTVEHGLQFECKLCSKQLESEAQLKIHVGICALYHEDRNRFCVICNRKYFDIHTLKNHRLRFHGTEEDKLSLYKFNCHICPKKFREATLLRFHMESHGLKKQGKSIKLLVYKCSHPNCGKGFRFNCDLQRHISNVHLDLRPFSCDFPNCNKTFSNRCDLEIHFRTHTGERPFKCTVDNCGKAFITSGKRLAHHRTVHRNLLSK